MKSKIIILALVLSMVPLFNVFAEDQALEGEITLVGRIRM